MPESRMVKSDEVVALLAKAKPGTTREQVEQWLLKRGHSVQIGDRWRNLEHEAKVKGMQLAQARGAMGLLPAGAGLVGQFAGTAAGAALGGPPGAFIGRTVGGAAGRVGGELVRRGGVALNPALENPDTPGGMPLLASAGIGVVESVLGGGIEAGSAMVGRNLARRAFRPTPTLVKGYMKEGGVAKKDRLLRQAAEDKITPSVEGVNLAGKLVQKSADEVDRIRMLQRASGHKVKLDDLAEAEIKFQSRVRGRPLTPKEEQFYRKRVAKELDAVFRDISGGKLKTVKTSSVQPASKVLAPSGAPAVAGQPSRTVVAKEFDPWVLGPAQRAAAEKGRGQYGRTAAGKSAEIAGGSPQAARLANSIRGALRAAPHGKELEAANRLLQARMGVNEMVTNAAASSQPSYIRPAFFPIGVPSPPMVTHAAGIGLQGRGGQMLGYGPTLADILAGYLGNLNPDTTEAP